MPGTDQGLSGASKSVRAVMAHTYQLAGRISIDKCTCVYEYRVDSRVVGNSDAVLAGYGSSSDLGGHLTV